MNNTFEAKWVTHEKTVFQIIEAGGHTTDLVVVAEASTKSNAHLIAAAPDLLRAVSRILLRYRSLILEDDCVNLEAAINKSSNKII